MPAEIHPARTDDMDALVALEELVFINDRISRRSFRRMIGSPRASLLVATDRDVVVGYCAVLYRSGSAGARLYSLAVTPDNGKGLGRQLLAAAEKAAIAMNCKAMRLEVREDNPRAVSLYEKNGYQAIGARPGYYADGMTALRFEKALDAPSDVEPANSAGTSSQ